MAIQQIVDAEDQLVVEKRKYYNFSLDRLEDLFTYANNIPADLLDNQSQVLERSIDAYVLNKVGEEAKAGNWVGSDLKVIGGTDTMASIVTTATGGTVTLVMSSTHLNIVESTSVEQFGELDGIILNGGFEANDLYKGFRLVSTATLFTPWYRISGVTDSVTASLTEWDEEVAGSDFAEGYTLRGVFGGDGLTFERYGTGDAALVGMWASMTGLGWEIQAAIATTVTAATIYDQVTLLNERLDSNEIPAEGRKIVLPPQGITALRQAAETQPSGIAEIYTGTVINGRVARFGSLDVHSAAGARLSTRAGHSASTGVGATAVLTAGAQGHLIPACTTNFMTFADKWSESRVVDAENQFAKKYQGLFLYGAKVPQGQRKHCAVLFASFR